MTRKCKIIFGLVLLGLSVRAVTGAAAQDRVVLPATGSAVTPEWKQYNAEADTKGAPLLKYVVTAKAMTQTKEREPAQIQDMFSLTDNELYVYTSWINVKDGSKYSIRIYDPRGVLFDDAERVYRFGTERWNLWDSLHVKGWAAARVPGKWRADVLMNGTLATTKEFYIGSDARRHEPSPSKESGRTIGVYPYFVDTEDRIGTTVRDNSFRLPLYLAQMLTLDFEPQRVVMPFELRRTIVNPKTKYDGVRGFLNQELKAGESEWNAMVKKHNLDLVIAGRVYDRATYRDEKEATIYLVESRTMNIKEIKASYKSLQERERTGFDVQANFYRAIYDEIFKPIADLLKK